MVQIRLLRVKSTSRLRRNIQQQTEMHDFEMNYLKTMRSAVVWQQQLKLETSIINVIIILTCLASLTDFLSNKENNSTQNTHNHCCTPVFEIYLLYICKHSTCKFLLYIFDNECKWNSCLIVIKWNLLIIEFSCNCNTALNINKIYKSNKEKSLHCKSKMWKNLYKNNYFFYILWYFVHINCNT